MRLQYQRVNPEIGGESVLLRFEGLHPDRTVCVLVNSGRGVDVGALLDESRDEYLGGVIVTAAHPEYYSTLGENIDEETPIYAAPDTAAILSVALTEPHARQIEHREAVLDQLVSVDDWFQLVPGLLVSPVPTGHAPGSAGFLFEIDDTDREDSHTMFLADEFTIRRAGGYPGIDLDFQVDSLLVSGITDEQFTPTLTEALSVVCERVRDEATVLITADEPTGIHAAYLLGHLGKRLGAPFPVTATGRIGALCNQLGYSIPNVATRPKYDAPKDVLTPGAVTIADPNSPVQGISGHLFGALAEDPTAAVVRLTRGTATPASPARCTVQSFPWHNAPTPDTLDTVVDALDPLQVVIGNGSQTPLESEDSFVWAVEDDLVYILYDGEQWVAPAEIDPDTEQRIRQRAAERHVGTESELPRGRCDDVDLAAEGLDADAVRDQLEARYSSVSWRRGPSWDVSGTGVTDGGRTSIDAALTGLHEQIDYIESTVGGRTYWGSVIDAGGDVCLLRVQDPPAVEHGQDVSLILNADDAMETTATEEDAAVDSETTEDAGPTSAVSEID